MGCSFCKYTRKIENIVNDDNQKITRREHFHHLGSISCHNVETEEDIVQRIKEEWFKWRNAFVGVLGIDKPFQIVCAFL